MKGNKYIYTNVNEIEREVGKGREREEGRKEGRGERQREKQTDRNNN